jgi:hypothetical protein
MNSCVGRAIKEASKMKKILFILALIIVVGVALSCSNARKEKYGKEISNYKLTALRDILAAPKEFEGKLVTIEGQISSECPSGCWFFVKVASGEFSIYVDIRPSGFAIPQYTGRKVLVEGTVYLDPTGPKIKGQGVEIK